MAEKDTRRKHISRGVEWRKFHLHSTFHPEVKRPQKTASISAKTLTIVHGFQPETENFDMAEKDTRRKHISRGVEWRKFHLHSTFHREVKRPQFQPKPLTIVHGFRPETQNFDFGKQGYQPKAYLKGSGIAHISASEHLASRSKKASTNGLNFGQNP